MSHIRNAPALWMAVSFAAICVGGCSSSVDPDQGRTDSGIIKMVVGVFADTTRDLKGFQNAFAKSAQPGEDDLKKYRGKSYVPDGAPSVSGDTATVSVKVSEGDKELGVVSWSLVREGEAWKIKEAPLP